MWARDTRERKMSCTLPVLYPAVDEVWIKHSKLFHLFFSSKIRCACIVTAEYQKYATTTVESFTLGGKKLVDVLQCRQTD